MGYKTDLEILLGQQIDLLRIEKGIKKHGNDWKDFLDDIPGFIHMNRKNGLFVHFVNNSGINEMGFTNTELNEMGHEYQRNHLDEYTMEITRKYLIPFIQKDNENKVFRFSQCFKRRDGKSYMQIFTATKPLRGTDLLLSYSLMSDNLSGLSKKISSVLEDEYFAHQNYLRYQSLSSREIEVLGLVASGYTNKQISDQLFISIETVMQHRKKIKRKTNSKNIVELIRFAQAFDLI